ncbi:hypothetical protein [Aurantimicrobium minutum]|uniref:hypothetical protein n=1 Tax=Aurantimicrobium minutum TaxID=708131 RepID=UPI002476FFE6|nr:hypothetical protein [Aurantimicrobium minutum]MDH6254499.1 hypothetical protein [Aurantimicrobium minutum]
MLRKRSMRLSWDWSARLLLMLSSFCGRTPAAVANMPMGEYPRWRKLALLEGGTTHVTG